MSFTGMLKEGSLQDKVILITGGGTGLGKSMGKYFMELGANLIITSRKQHVLDELDAYSNLVSVGSYIVACDGIMESLVGAPRSDNDWDWDNPKVAAEEFVSKNKKFIIEEPQFPFNEGEITERVTYWPSAFVKRVR